MKLRSQREHWRLIRDSFGGGPENMAVDEALLSALNGEIPEGIPTFRLYGWKQSTISVGYMQRRVERLLNADLPVVRRITGGRAVLHSRAELTYSVVCGEAEDIFSMGIGGAYSLISSAILSALKDIGIQAECVSSGPDSQSLKEKDSCFHAASRSEILAGGRKLVGSAQRRFNRSMLQHGSIVFDVDAPLMDMVFGEGAHKGVASLSDFSDITIDAFSEILVTRMGKALDTSFEVGTLTGAETALKDALLKQKYLKNEWNIDGAQYNVTAKEAVNG